MSRANFCPTPASRIDPLLLSLFYGNESDGICSINCDSSGFEHEIIKCVGLGFHTLASSYLNTSDQDYRTDYRLVAIVKVILDVLKTMGEMRWCFA